MSSVSETTGPAACAVTATGAHLLIQSIKIYERRWTPADTVADGYRGLVYLCHGFAEHSGYFHHLAEQLAGANFLVIGHDYYGHGLSDGSLNQLKSFATLVDTAIVHVARLRSEWPNLPIHGIGYSMGALILHQLSEQNPQLLSSMIWLSPALQPVGMKLTKRKAKVGQRLLRLMPNFPLPGGKFRPADLTRNKETQEQMRTDASIKQRTLHSRMCGIMLGAMAGASPDGLRVPLLVAVGTEDRIADAGRTAGFVADAQSMGKPVASLVYRGGYHQLHTDLPAAGIPLHRDLLQWLLAAPSC